MWSSRCSSGGTSCDIPAEYRPLATLLASTIRSVPLYGSRITPYTDGASKMEALLAEIARRVDDPRLGLCLDIGHANTFVSRVPPLEWVAPMAPWLRHVHLHNNAGHDDLHDPLGQGTLAMEQVLDTILELCPAATFTLENQDCGPSLAWLREHGYGANT